MATIKLPDGSLGWTYPRPNRPYDPPKGTLCGYLVPGIPRRALPAARIIRAIDHEYRDGYRSY